MPYCAPQTLCRTDFPDCLHSLRRVVGGTLQGMSEGVWDQVVDHRESCQAIVMLKQPLHSLHCSTSTEPSLESYRLGAHEFPKAPWTSDNSSSVVKLIDKHYL